MKPRAFLEHDSKGTKVQNGNGHGTMEEYQRIAITESLKMLVNNL
jgi:hypothetical protein